MVGPPFVLVAEVHDAEVRLERRERVVGDLGGRRGQGGEQRGLAGIRQPDQPDVGDEAQLQAEPVLLARLALLGVLGRLVGRRLEVRVAEAAATAARHGRLLARRDQVGDAALRSRRRRSRSRAAPPGGDPRRPCRAGAPSCRGRRACALKWWRYWKSRSVVSPGSTRRRMDPPRPPSPPSGPPRGTCASWRKVAAPSPPSPARTQIFTRSRNIVVIVPRTQGATDPSGSATRCSERSRGRPAG